MSNKSIFNISVDVELGWGFILNPRYSGLTLLRNDPQKGRGAVNTLLDIFQRYDIPATWAIVGHLLLDAKGRSEIVQWDMPQFREGWLTWDFYNSIRDDPIYCGDDIVEKILSNPVRHEIGLHSFFHLPFSDSSREVARAEVELGVRAAKNSGLSPRSFVFPQNKVKHLTVLAEAGFKIYRSKDQRYWDEKQKPVFREFNALIDKLIAQPVVPLHRSSLWELPGSMFFCDPHLSFSLVPRARLGLKRAIEASQVFDIWLHPHNLLSYQGLTGDLERFLAVAAREREAGKLEVMTMGELVDKLEEGLR